MDGGERDLDKLLKSLNPKLYPDRYEFAADSSGASSNCFAVIHEEEGTTVVRPDPNGEWARITLGAHSSLEAVGLTAILASRLASVGISANVIAGLRHDHFFVQWDRRDEALELLSRA